MDDFSLTPDIVNRTIAENWAEAPHRCVEISPTHALAKTVTADVSLRPGGFIPGPTQFSLADVVLWYLAFGALDRIEPMALTSELSIRFLRPAQGETMWARAELDKAGRSSVVGTVKIWMDDRPDRLVSTTQGTYALPRD